MSKPVIFLDTLGCKVNQYESQAMRELLARQGFTFSLEVKDADVFVLNTCIVTESSEQECLLKIKNAKEKNSRLKIVAAGCLADSGRRAEGADQYITNADKQKIAALLAGEELPFENLKISGISGQARAIVKIQDGCDNFCSYCVVPNLRGKVKSRDLKEIFEEIKTLTDAGCKEIELVGKNIGCYGEDLDTGLNLSSVLSVAAGAVGDGRIRLGSIEPEHVTDDLLDVMEDSKHVCGHLHIPLQSGDDTILRLMNRNYSTGSFRKTVNKARGLLKELCVTTDLIAGFPGETEDNFRQTADFAEELAFAGANIFAYSDRPGTGAAGLGHKVTDGVKLERAERLSAACAVSAEKYSDSFIGKEAEVLLLKALEGKKGLYEGLSANNIRVFLENTGMNLVNTIVKVRLEKANGRMIGRVVQ